MYIAPGFDFVRAYRKIIRFSHARVQNIGETSLWPYFSTKSCQIVNYPVFEKRGAECRSEQPFNPQYLEKQVISA